LKGISAERENKLISEGRYIHTHTQTFPIGIICVCRKVYKIPLQNKAFIELILKGVKNVFQLFFLNVNSVEAILGFLVSVLFP
jgi:hypothetical protein